MMVLNRFQPIMILCFALHPQRERYSLVFDGFLHSPVGVLLCDLFLGGSGTWPSSLSPSDMRMIAY